MKGVSDSVCIQTMGARVNIEIKPEIYRIEYMEYR